MTCLNRLYGGAGVSAFVAMLLIVPTVVAQPRQFPVDVEKLINEISSDRPNFVRRAALSRLEDGSVIGNRHLALSHVIEIAGTDPDVSIQMEAAETLTFLLRDHVFGETDRAAADKALRVHLYKATEPSMRLNAAIGLATLGAKDEAVIEPLLEALVGRPVYRTTLDTIAALQNMKIESVESRLIALTEAPIRNLRYNAMTTLEKYRGPRVLEALTAVAKDPDAFLRSHAIHLLTINAFLNSGGESIERENVEAKILPVVVAGLNDSSLEVQKSTLLAVSRARPAPVQIIPELQRIMFDAERKARIDVVNALRAYGADADPVVPLLIDRLRDPNPDVREKAAWACLRLAAVSGSAEGPLVVSLRDEHRMVRYWAVQALGELPNLSPVGATAMQQTAEADNDERIRSEAKAALNKRASRKQVLPKASP